LDWDPSVFDQGLKEDEQWGDTPGLELSFDEFGECGFEDDKKWGEVLIPDFSDDVQWGEVPTPDSSFGKVPDDRSLHSRMSGWESHIYTESPNDRSHVDKSKNAESPFSCPQISPNMLPCPLLPVCTLMGSNYHLLQNLLQKNPLPFSIF
jgi:hypothetical protein